MNKMHSTMLALAVLLPAVAGAGEQVTLNAPQAGIEYGPVKEADGAGNDGDKMLSAESVDLTPSKRALVKKAKSIVIPNLQVREANIRNTMAFLRQEAKASDPDGKGVNIVVMLPPGDDSAQPVLTLDIQNVSLIDTLRYSCEAARLHMRIDDNAIVLLPAISTSVN